MILTHGHRNIAFSRTDQMKRRLFSFEKFLYHYTTAGVAKGIAREHIGDSFLGLLQRFGDDYTLARCQTIGLNDNRCALLTQVSQCRFDLSEICISAGGNLVASEKVFGEGF